MNVSEPRSRKKKPAGRPPAMPPDVEVALEALGLFDGMTSRRARLNVYYRQRALEALRHEPGMGWLFDWEKMTNGSPDAWRPAILSEIGRLGYPEMIQAAQWCCGAKPSTEQTRVALRRWRCNTLPAGTAESLFERLVHTVDDFRASHEMEQDDVEVALVAFLTAMNGGSPETGEALGEVTA